MTLGAMGGVIGMTKEAMAPAFGAGSQIGQGLGTMIGGTDSGMPDSAGEAGAAVGAVSGTGNVAGNTAKNGTDTWDCTCGRKGITSKFCPECGPSGRNQS